MTKKVHNIVRTVESENLVKWIELSQKLIHGAVRIQQEARSFTIKLLTG